MQIAGIDYEAEGVRRIHFDRPESVDGSDLVLWDTDGIDGASDDEWLWRENDFKKYLSSPSARVAVLGWHPDFQNEKRPGQIALTVRRIHKPETQMEVRHERSYCDC